MPMIAIDTNVLAYAEGIDDLDRKAASLTVIRSLPGDAIVIAVQALGELFNVLVRRGWPVARVLDVISAWHDGYTIAPTTPSAMAAAVDLAAAHRLHIWDAVMVSVAAESGCRALLSEDMQDGFTWRGVTVVNPFVSPRHPVLTAMLEAGEDER
jgi:predicted nucleic acid-binding protein